MLEVTVVLINKLGLHARASAKFVSTALRFQSQLMLIKDHQSIDGKSIMAVMTLGAGCGTPLTLRIDGPDEQALSEALVSLINHRFGESE